MKMPIELGPFTDTVISKCFFTYEDLLHAIHDVSFDYKLKSPTRIWPPIVYLDGSNGVTLNFLEMKGGIIYAGITFDL